MDKLIYELPSYATNPDIPRDLDTLVNALDQQVLTLDDKSDLEIRFQEKLAEMQEYITALSESNAVPTLYQLSSEVVAPKYQVSTVVEVEEVLIINIIDFVGKPLTQTMSDDIGEYISFGSDTSNVYMIYGIDSPLTYVCIRSNFAYKHGISTYDKTNIREADLVISDEELAKDDWQGLEGYYGEEDYSGLRFMIYEESSIPSLYAMYNGDHLSTIFPNNYSMQEVLYDLEIPLFSVFYQKLTKTFRMWDGKKFVDFGQTFLPQEETYTKDEIDAITGLNSSEIAKREYKFQSGSNVYIDRTNEENPTLNVLNFDALDKTKDAITSFTVKEDETSGYDVTLNTLSSAESGGFKIKLDNVRNDVLDTQISDLTDRVSNNSEMIDDIKTQDILWSGEWYMDAAKTINLTQNVDTLNNGLVFVWSAYNAGEVRDYHWNSFFIPKKLVELMPGKGHVMHGSLGATVTSFSNLFSKYIYIFNDKVMGNDDNIKNSNNVMVLRYIIGV